jgi:hypothetical protein
MSLLAGIGRARPFSNLTGNILENTQGLFKTQMTMEQMEQERRSREIQDNLNTLKLQETQADIEKRRRPVFLDDFQARYPDPATGKYYADQLKATGYVKTIDIGGTKREYFEHGDFKEINTLIEGDEKRHEGYLGSQLTDLGQKKAALNDEYRKAAEKGDAEKAQKLKDQFDDIASKEGIIFDAYRRLKKPEADGMTDYQKESLDVRKSVAEASEESKRERLEETERHNKETEEIRRETLADKKEARKVAGGNLGFADKEAIRSMGKQLPKSKTLAETATKNIMKIDRMLALIDKGAGGVKGELIAKINKVADVLRTTSPEDAKYNTLKSELRGFAGQLRLQLGLIGQTSDRDVQIMYEAAGGGTPAESQRAIIQGYRQGYMEDINNYNSDAEAYSKYSPAGGTLYRQINVPSVSSTPAPPAAAPKSFASEADATKAAKAGKVRPGDRITINGVSGTWR